MIISNIAASGCILYPISFTCFDSFFGDLEKIKSLELCNGTKYGQRPGATPNYRVDDFDEYLRNFNWISNWVDKYFFNKFFDFFFLEWYFQLLF